MNEQTRLEDFAGGVRPRHASNVLLWIIAGFFILFLVWASFTKLDRSVRGQGRVIASSHMQVISNLEGGIVKAILVKTGQQVQKGQELIRLDRAQSGSELGTGEASVNALQVKVGRLQAEMAGRSPNYPASSDPEVVRQASVEQSLHAARMAELASITNAGISRISQASESIQVAQGAYQARGASRDAKLDQLKLIKPLVEKGIEPRMSLIQAQSGYDVSVKAAEQAAATLQRARALSSAWAAVRSVPAWDIQVWRCCDMAARASPTLARARCRVAAACSASLTETSYSLCAWISDIRGSMPFSTSSS